MGKLTHTVKAPVAFFRSADKASIESLKLHFLPKQEGGGDPSPQNIRNILGWTGCTAFKAKKNLFDNNNDNLEYGYIKSADGSIVYSESGKYTVYYTKVKPSTAYALKGTGNTGILTSIAGYDINKNYISRVGQQYNVSSSPLVFTTPSNCYYIRFSLPVDFSNYQLEEGFISTSYENYNCETIPISWSDHGVEYGGYVDPAKGKLVAEYEMLTDTWGNWGTAQDQGDGTILRVKKFTNPVYGNSINNHHTDYCNVTKYVYANENGNPHYYIVGNSYNCRVYLPNDLSTDQVIQVIGKLITPIEYDFTPTEIQTFLDYNNFWTDMNDDTEVEYAFADRLSIRKSLMVPETRIVNWNQLQQDGNFTDVTKWEISNEYGTSAMSNNVATWTCTSQPTQFYQTGFRIKNGTGNSNFLSIPWNHKVLVRFYARCSISSRIRLYGLIGSYGNTYIYNYNHGNANIPANEWTKIQGFISNRPETPPSSADDVVIKRFKATLTGTSGTISTITVGTTFDMKNFMAFDLTQMFGLGNEPSTVEEFEHICRINGIDLDTYQPYDLGSNRLMIMPM